MDQYNTTCDYGSGTKACREQTPIEAQHSELAAAQSETLAIISKLEELLSHVLVPEPPTKPGENALTSSPTQLAEMLNNRIDCARIINERLVRLLGRIHL